MFEAIQFSTFAEFLDMGGDGVKIWAVYGLFFIFLATNLILPMRKRKQIFKEQKRRLVIQQEIAEKRADSQGQNGSAPQLGDNS